MRSPPQRGARGLPVRRRELTVMFCDLVGLTALSAQLDPEDWRTLVRDHQRTYAAVIHRFEGQIAQYFGDGRPRLLRLSAGA
jgi:class 3 adenylate cyclase